MRLSRRGFQTSEAAMQAVHKLLESSFWPRGISPNTAYRRQHDDTDGKPTGFIQVILGEDADAWMLIDEPDGLRFRTYHGGGRSLRVRNALVILAEAIRLDNLERPQIRAVSATEAR